MNLVGILKPIVGRMRYARLMYMSHPTAVSSRRKVLSVGLLYAVSPIDLVPGIIPLSANG